MRLSTESEIQAFLMARELIKRGLRTHVIGSLTGLSPQQVRCLYDIMGIRTVGNRGGPTPKTATVCRNRMTQVRLSIFATIYHRLNGRKAGSKIDPAKLILSYDTAQALCPTPELDLTLAWTLATELKLGLVELHGCPDCAASYIRILESLRIPLSCPFCAVRTRLARRLSASQASGP